MPMWSIGSPHNSGDMTTHATTQPEIIHTRTAGTSSLRRAGGIAALVKAATYIVGFGVMGAYLAPRGLADAQGDPGASLSFLLDNQAAMYSWYLVLYLVGGIALVSLVLGVHDALRRKAPTLSLTAGVFGTIWAGLLLASGLISLVGQRAVVELATSDTVMAESTWSSVSVIQDALGGGIEIVGAVWVFLVSIAGIRSGVLGRGLCALGIATGVIGAWTLLPAVADAATAMFGIAFIVWFVWAGVVLLRGQRR